MFANRAFNIAFLISLAWHLFWMSAVNVVVLPGRYKARELTSVSFLGPLLEKTALDIMLVNKPVAVTTRYQHSLKYAHSFDKKEDGLHPEKVDREEVEERIYARAENEISKIPVAVSLRDKEIPNIVKVKRPKDTQLKGPSEISGVAAKREVIYKPIKPQVSSRIKPSAPFILELGFSVSAQGEVNEVVPVVSSGDPEVDLLGIRYLKNWKFAPLRENSQESQEGRIKLVFGAEEKQGY